MTGSIDSSTTGMQHHIRIATSFAEIDRQKWGQLGGTRRGCATGTFNPFVSHDFLSALEEADCATAETGWLGQHLLLETENGDLLGALPCYLKSHSRGEYVFDYGWADAFERAGGQYYPKLQSSVPFTPATGPRLLSNAASDPSPVRAAMAHGLRQLADRLQVSGAHATFVPDDEFGYFQTEGFLHRTDQQFHFRNEEYASYEQFLETLTSRKRKALRKERRAALGNGIDIRWLTGSDLTETVWDRFFEFYADTGLRKWGRPYLTRRFFSLVGERMAEDILLVMAVREGRYIAGAINFIGSDTLYGRHWGCLEHHPYLHFEVCYHQAIDFAIARGLKIVEAGAQGEHKLARGYMPVTTHSAHYLSHPGLRRAVAEYLKDERQDVERIGHILEGHGPFRKGPVS